MANGLLIFGVVIIVGFIGNLLYARTKIPESVFLILIGILLGPVLGVIPTDFFDQNSSFLISLALVVVLLDSGLSLNISKALANAPIAIFFTILVMLCTMFIVGAVTVFFFDWTWFNGLFLGIIGSGTTTITITHLVQKLSVGKNTKTLLILESIVNDITLILGTSIFISFISSGATQSAIPKIIFNELIISTILGVVFSLVWTILFLKYMHGNQLGYVFTLGLAFAIFDSVEYFGFNGPIAVLVFSLVLGNYSFIVEKIKAYTPVLSPIISDISIVRGVNYEITFLMRTLFFVFLGVIFKMDTTSWYVLMFVFIIVVSEVLSRYLAARTLSLFKPNYRNSVPIITTLVASGFTSTLVAFFSRDAGINIPNLTEIVLFEVIITTLWATIGTAVLQRVLDSKKTATY